MDNVMENLQQAKNHEYRLRAELKATVALVQSLEKILRLQTGGDAVSTEFARSMKKSIRELIIELLSERGVMRVAEIARALNDRGRTVSPDTVAGIISREIKENQTFEKVARGRFRMNIL